MGYHPGMKKSVGAEIADRFKKGDKKLAEAIDAALEAERHAARMFLAAVVIEHGAEQPAGLRRLTVSHRSIRAVSPHGTLSEVDLPDSMTRLLTYKPPPDTRPPPKTWT
jgi:hypothetical protein